MTEELRPPLYAAEKVSPTTVLVGIAGMGLPAKKELASKHMAKMSSKMSFGKMF
jgi:hypothetical protein